MKTSYKVIAGVVTSLSLGLAVAAAYAEPGQAGTGMGSHMKGDMQQGGPHAGAMAGQQLMTAEERSALQQKMRSAATPEERQKLAEATRTEMQRRATEKGITLPAPGTAAGAPSSHSH